MKRHSITTLMKNKLKGFSFVKVLGDNCQAYYEILEIDQFGTVVIK